MCFIKTLIQSPTCTNCKISHANAGLWLPLKNRSFSNSWVVAEQPRPPLVRHAPSKIQSFPLWFPYTLSGSFIYITGLPLLACELATLILWFQGMVISALIYQQWARDLLKSFLSDSWNTCRSSNTRLETRLLISVPEMFCGSSICTSGPSFKLFNYPPWATEIPSVRLGYTGSDSLMIFKLGYVHLKVCPRRTCSWIGLREFPDPLDILYSFLKLICWEWVIFIIIFSP